MQGLSKAKKQVPPLPCLPQAPRPTTHPSAPLGVQSPKRQIKAPEVSTGRKRIFSRGNSGAEMGTLRLRARMGKVGEARVLWGWDKQWVWG